MSEQEISDVFSYVQYRVNTYARYCYVKSGHKSIPKTFPFTIEDGFVFFEDMNLHLSDIISMDIQKLTNEADEMLLKYKNMDKTLRFQQYLKLKKEFEEN